LVYAITISVGFASAVVVLPVLIKRSLHLDMGYYNACQSLFSVGALISSVLIAQRLRGRGRGKIAHGMSFVIGLSLLSAALPLTIYGITVAWLIRGLAVTILSLTWVGTLQQMVPREMLGRVASIDAFVQVVWMITTVVTFGWLTDVIQPEAVLLWGGVFVSMVAVVALMHPRIRTLV
jgi:hypothetical protein